MIASLRGTVLERIGDGSALIEVGGVGYLVTVTPRTLAELEPSAVVFLHVHHHIREDAQTLFGFLTRDERTSFLNLIAAHGVGPTLAMAVLATHTPNALVDIVASNDAAALTLVPGVGKKTAERLLVELKGRFSLPLLESTPVSTGARSSAVGNVREGLLGLGYGELEIREALRDLPVDRPAAEILRDALKVLGARRAG